MGGGEGGARRVGLVTDPVMAARLDPIARKIFMIALRDGRCGEVLACLFEGGGATVDPDGALILIAGDLIAQLAESGS